MKKVLLLSLSLILGFSAFAQKRQQVVVKKDSQKAVASKTQVAVGKENVQSTIDFTPRYAKSVVVNRWEEMEDAETMQTTYDLQSNQYVANRMYQLPNGSVAVTATWSAQPNKTASDRGTGYNFYNAEDDEWLDQPTARVEGTTRTGWPTIAQWGENGEILLSHGNGALQCYTREIAGEGEWEYRGALPLYPDDYPYEDEYPTWARIATSGDNHNIANVVAAIQHTIDDDNVDTRILFFRTEDAEHWTVSYGPLAENNEYMDKFSADDYCIDAVDHTVAVLFSGCVSYHTLMFKSTDDGLNWERTVIWEDPYGEYDWSTDSASIYTEQLYRPMNGSIALDKNGVAHVALNTFCMIHDTLDGVYSYYYGRTVDGIFYWNDTQEAPIQSPDGNPHNAANMWWEQVTDSTVHMSDDSTRWIGYIPMWTGYSWDNSKYYHSGTDYYQRFYGASGHPALSIDPYGNIACAFSTPDVRRTDATTGNKYFRTIFVSYYNADEGYWELRDNLMEDFMYELSEGLFCSAVTRTNNPGEFWFSAQTDEKIGLYWGSNTSQTTATQNEIHVYKVMGDWLSVPENTEAKDVIYNIYPNPVTDNTMTVYSAQAADATITIVNLVGQTVKQFNKNLVLGANSINVDLKSGVYFCTISANGFDKTVKFIVK